MEFVRIEHGNIDRKKWDRVVSRSECPSLFASSFYLDAVSPGWEALVLGDYKTVFPLTKKSKMGYTYLPHPPFTGMLGLFGEINKEIESRLYEYLKEKFRLVEIELNPCHHLKIKGTGEKNSYAIDYSKPYRFNENSRRNIKRALSLGLTVEQLPDDKIIDFSNACLDPFLREQLKVNAYGLSRFHALLKNAILHRQLLTFVVKNTSGEILAIAHFIYDKHSVIYLKGTNLDKWANSGSMHLLMSHAIGHFKSKTAHFDFSGGSLPGIGRFFEGLGGKAYTYPLFRYNNLPKLIKILKGKS